MNLLVVERVRATPLRIPVRSGLFRSLQGALAWHPTIICVELRGGVVGYGELAGGGDANLTSVAAIEQTLTHIFGPALLSFRAVSFPEALEAIEALPARGDWGAEVRALRAAVELALLDAVLRACHRGVDDVVRWMGLPGFGRPGSVHKVRYAGSVEAEGAREIVRALRRWYWFGVRDFRLVVTVAGNLRGIEAAAAYLERSIMQGRVTLRVDARGAWTKEDTLHWIAETAGLGIAALEQPLPRGSEVELPIVADVFDGALVFDESLIGVQDAARLSALELEGVFHIAISKCGGLMPALRLAGVARREDRDILLGCAAAETSLLAAAGVRFLEVCPAVRWAEGCDGARRFSGDVCRGRVRFGFGGRPPALLGEGLGVSVDRELLARWAIEEPLVLKM